MLPGRLGSDSQVHDRALHAAPCKAPVARCCAEPPARTATAAAACSPQLVPAARHHLRHLQGQENGSAAAWSIADDVFQARYQAGGSHTEGAWQPLPQLSLQLEAAAPSGGAEGGRAHARQQQAQRRPASSAAAALPAEEPWLLAAAAYASEGGAWTAGRTATTRARMLFQYKPYSQQEPLGASEAEVAAVVEAVFGRAGPGPSAFEVGADGLLAWCGSCHLCSRVLQIGCCLPACCLSHSLARAAMPEYALVRPAVAVSFAVTCTSILYCVAGRGSLAVGPPRPLGGSLWDGGSGSTHRGGGGSGPGEARDGHVRAVCGLC